VNFLAHCALGSEHPDYLVGGFLGDFIKGPVPTHLSERIRIGVRLHRRLDAYSALQPDIRTSVARLPSSIRRVAPVFIDLVADHFLARHFEVIHAEPLTSFSKRTYAILAGHSDHFPPQARRFFHYLKEYDLFGRYVGVDAVERAFARIGERLGLERVVMPAMTALGDHYNDFESDFLRYYPALQQHAKQWLAQFPQEAQQE
jgi:acyl carrier protein phosphodiesterase